MNTIGKILVILNFLFAIIVGILLVVDFAARNQWKDAYMNLKTQAETVKSVGGADQRAMIKVAGDYQDAKSKVEALNQQLKDEEDKAKVLRDEDERQKVDLNNQVVAAKLVNADLLSVKKRLADEVAQLTGVIKDREAFIVRLDADVKRFRNDAVQFQGLLKTAQIQNENLLQQVQDLSLKIRKLETGVANVAGGVRDPNAPNPPAVTVNGKIEKVEGADLVLLSLGTDHGVANGNTLDVYRTQPTAKYLGMVRIINAGHHVSVARLIPTGNAAFRPKLLEGDLVTSKLIKGN